MIKSKIIADILELATDDNDSSDLLKKQILFLTEKEVDHTGIGLFVYFDYDRDISELKISPKENVNILKNGDRIFMLDGIEIKNDSENILADAIVHLINGIIYSIEIFNKNGEGYPSTELKSYEMTQTWLDEEKRKTIIRIYNHHS